MKHPMIGPNEIISRLAKPRLEKALESSRVTWIGGPRQAGKSTLAMSVASKDMPFVSLDDQAPRNFAQSDPVGFLQYYGRAIIDEVQIAPDLIHAIKVEVDRDPRWGRYLLTGSANLLTIPRVSESLAGRMSLQPLLPLSQSEVRGGAGTFLDTVFGGEKIVSDDMVQAPELAEIVLSGGFPDALRREERKTRQIWYDGYIGTILQRDLTDIAQIERPLQMRRLLLALAHYSGKIISFSKIGNLLGMNHVTTKKYMGLLEDLYMFQTVPSWLTNRLKRLTKAPKLYFLDSGLLAHLLKVHPETVLLDRSALGPIAETFVYAELTKQATWSEGTYEFMHMRNREGMEVDIVVEDHAGRVVGIEVKATANVTPRDFAGLHTLEAACGDRFLQGIILCGAQQPISHGKKMMIMPMSFLWC